MDEQVGDRVTNAHGMYGRGDEKVIPTHGTYGRQGDDGMSHILTKRRQHVPCTDKATTGSVNAVCAQGAPIVITTTEQVIGTP